MKKLFSLFFLMAALCFAASAETYTLAASGKSGVVQTPEGSTFFTYTTDVVKTNTKYTGTYNGVTYQSGIKIQSSTKIYFTTSTQTSTLTVVQSLTTNSGNTIKFNGEILSGGVDNENGNVDVRVFTVENVGPGSYTIEQGSKETGILFISVEETGSQMEQLEAPVITATGNGIVTIAPVANATKIMYTIDGSTPSATNGEEYSAPFEVETGTTVKAIAIGNGESTTNSNVSELLVVRDDVALDPPTIKHINGSVEITSSVSGVTIQYSLDGTTWIDYTRTFTLAEDATLYARAKNGSTLSDEVSAEVTVLPTPVGTTRVILDWSSFVDNSANKIEGTGKFAGYTLQITSNESKKLSSSLNKINVLGEEKMAIKTSNGATNTLTLPEGVTAKKLTIYSFSYAGDRVCYWKEVAGENYTTATAIPLQAQPKFSDYLTVPDSRSYDVDGSSITFTNAGEQTAVVIVLDVEGGSGVDFTFPDTDLYTFCPEYDVTIPEGVTAYGITNGTVVNGELTLDPVTTGTIKAGEGVFMKAEAAGKVTFNIATEAATAIEGNIIVGATADVEIAEGEAYILGANNMLHPSTAGTLAKGKAYIPVAAVSGANHAPRLSFGGTTGINIIENAANNGVYYNVYGQKVDANFKGIVICNGKKFYNK